MSESTSAAVAPPVDDFEENRRKTKKALPALLTVFTLGQLMTQAFNLVFQNIGDSLGMSQQAALISTLPGIVLGVVCMLYGTLCDFISPKRLTVAGVGALVVGALLGFFGAGSFWAVVIARMIQVAGGQVCGSVFLVMVVKYLRDNEKSVYIGVFNAIFYLASGIGVLAGGVVSAFDWKFLFLIPLLALLVLPLIVKNTPDVSGLHQHIDWVGITLFAIIAALLAIVFSFPSVWLVVAIVVLGIVFGVYVAKAKQPFLTVSMVKNLPFMVLLSMIFLFCFFDFACVPIYNVIAADVYDISLTMVSVCLFLVYVVAVIVGLITGPIVNAIGRERTIILAAVMMVIGFCVSGLLVKSGLVLLTILACLFMAGMTLVYTPLYDSTSDSLPVEERGRGIGLCDLSMNTGASLGMAVYSSLMASPAFASVGFFGIEPGPNAAVSNMFWIMGLAALVTLLIFLTFRKRIRKGVEENAGE